MNFSGKKLGLLAVAAFACSALAIAENARDIPIHTAPRPNLENAARILNAARNPLGTKTPQTHVISGNALIFQPLVTPCRIVDTRTSGTYLYGGPKFSNAEARVYDFYSGGTSASCPQFPPFGSSLPTNVLGWYANITITAPTGGPGFLTAFPDGTSRPTAATLNWAVANDQVNNSVIIPGAAPNGVFDLYASTSTHVIIDLVGIFISNLSDRGDQLVIVTNDPGAAAILGQNDSSTNGSHAIGGFESGTGTVHGVQGQISSSADTGSSGVHGIGGATGKATYGVLGEAISTAISSAGVRGIAGDGPPPGAAGCCFQAGVRGDSNNDYGVVGISQFIGTFGILVNTAGTQLAKGELGLSVFAGPWGVFAEGNVGATGTKPFVEVHPTDPAKLIRYVALEGPEAGTYFRGTDEIVAGMAVIQVPESFRLVSDTEGLTVQLTPIGAPAVIYVVSQDLNQIVVRSSRDVRFHYMVNGIRATFKDWQVIVGDSGYMPDGPEARLPAYFSPEQQRRLIANGTYNPDGTVNIQTARKLGWVKSWEARAAQPTR